MYLGVRGQVADERTWGRLESTADYPSNSSLDAVLGWAHKLYVPRLHGWPSCLAQKPESLIVGDGFAVVFKDNGRSVLHLNIRTLLESVF